MFSDLYQWLPPEGVKILLVLFLSFLVGIEREEHKVITEQYSFGGVRTFPLIGLIGYSMAVLSGGQMMPITVGFVVVAGFLLLSYWFKLVSPTAAGVTTEISALATYLVGALVYGGHFWIATTLIVASVLLLQLKAGLEGLTQRMAPEEILTFAKFLLLTAVILPILPNNDLGPFQINPFNTWLVVVAVSTVSYGSYVLQKMTKGHGGVILSSVLGGAYSSTVTTVVLSRRSFQENRPHLFSGAILMASGVMYLRVLLLLALFNRNLMTLLAPSFVVLAGLAAGTGWFWAHRHDPSSQEVTKVDEPKNPLELRAALLFAFLFVLLLVATRYVATYLGRAGVYSLAAIMGVADVIPFIMGMTQAAGRHTPLQVGAASILIAAASNSIFKGIYAYVLSRRQKGFQTFCLLAGLAVLGLVPLLWLSR
jgi:uncharacterized membrane protein (DUF4010 family)